MTPARALQVLCCLLLSVCGTLAQAQQCPATVPVEGAAPPGPLPLFPATNWWNLDIHAAPVDPGSSGYIAFVNNGGTRKLHPDFGGEESAGSVNIYGMPYAVVNGAQPKLAVTFQYASESDGVDHSTGASIPFYPIPLEAVTQPHWIEGGAPGNVDQRSSSDRHLLIIDCSNKYLYELYNVFYSTAQGNWLAGSGAFFDMNTDDRRPDGWTSADAAGLAIFPGLVRYDEAWNAAIADIGHALRVTVRATNGAVYPASHVAGSSAGALPMGARLRLKASVNGQDPALRTSDPNVQKIFKAMQKYGLIVADNGSDMYISGTFDTRWNNDILNPAFALLSAGDFEVVQLGWNPPSGTPALAAISANPNPVVGGNPSTGSVSLSAAAGSGGVVVLLSSSNPVAAVPSSVAVAQGATAASFSIPTSAVTTATSATLSASYGGVTKTTLLDVTPVAAPALSALAISPSSVVGGAAATGTVTLSAAAPTGGTLVGLGSSNAAVASTPANVLVPSGASSANFVITTAPSRRAVNATITATLGAVKKSATMAVTRR